MYFVVCSQGLHFPFNSWDNFQGFLQHSIYCTSPASEAWIWLKIVSNRSEASEAGKPFKRNVFPLRDSSATKVQVLSLSFLNAGLFQPPKYLLSIYISYKPASNLLYIYQISCTEGLFRISYMIQNNIPCEMIIQHRFRKDLAELLNFR